MSYQEAAVGSAYDNCISFHAEVNALLYSDRSRHEGGTIYITRRPCNWCTKLLCASGLALAVWPDAMGSIVVLDLTSGMVD